MSSLFIVRSSWIVLILVFILSTFNYQLSTCYAQEVMSSKELIEFAKKLDGKKVAYKGEVITAVMDRGQHAWLNLYDGDKAIGVWCAKDDVGQINFIGNYKNRGDIIKVEGTFNRACPIHGGELDIHADTVTIVKSGYPVTEEENEGNLNIAIIIFLIILLAGVVFKKRL